MVGILIVAHGALGKSLIDCASHVFGVRPAKLEQLEIRPDQDPQDLLGSANVLLSELDEGDGVLVLSDLLGATPCNIVCMLLKAGSVEGISGVNLSMLIRAITYRREPLPVLVQKTMAGGLDGIQHLATNNAAA
ncbi:MAG: PTS fructose transporter subunit IIA [Betaproteobacteria bacterium]|nr:PTS fructose transporter subunit IIA [Betaproteobacteria bacterium]